MSSDAEVTGAVGDVNVVPEKGGIPIWALITAVAFIAIGGLFLSTKDHLERSGLIASLKDATVELVKVEDGFDRTYGDMFIQTNVSDFNLVLGMCYSKPEQALAVFNGLMEEGAKKEGLALGCRIGHCLIVDDKISEQDRERVLKSILKQTDEEASEEVQRVAQSWISDLLVMTNADQKKIFEEIAVPKDGKKEDFKVRAYEEDGVDSKLLTIQWATPKAFRVWWKSFGSSKKWNAELKRFVISAGKDSGSAL